MQLPQIFLALGEDRFPPLLRTISMGKLRTYQLFERLKTRAHLHKLNQENLRKAAPRLWERLQEGDDELAADLSQCILIGALDMIVEVLDFLGVPHNDGFFDKDANVKDHLAEGWQQRVYDNFREKYADAILLFYLNHLAHEVNEEAPAFLPAEAG
jgi:hypothetical protein